MSLRARLTLTVAAIVAVAVLGGMAAAQISVSRELRSETDKFLVERSQRFTGPAGARPRRPAAGLPPDPDRRGLGGFADYDAVTQVLAPDGTVAAALPYQPSLPVDQADATLAAGGSGEHFRDVTVDGVHYRMLTVALPEGGAVQIARDTSENHDVLGGLRTRLILIALLGIGAAALVAWLVGRRTTRPVEQLTAAAEHIAATQELSTPIEVSGSDEVGRLASSFNTMLVALDTSRQQQRRLVADASHELRTPLTALRTNLDFLARADTLGADERRQLLDETRLEADELSELVAELVELATEARSDEPVEPVALADVVEEVAARFRRRSGRDVVVALHRPGTVLGRRAMLDRAVSNLVDNALKFSPPATPVEVTLTGCRLEVADRGPGVALADRDRVFDRFYRSEATRTLPGSGLGLAIVQQVTEVHGGTVSLDERVGGGAVARVDLPPAPVPPPLPR